MIRRINPDEAVVLNGVEVTGRQLAEARQELSHRGVYNPRWDELSQDEQDMAALSAGSWLRALAGLVVMPDPDHACAAHDDAHLGKPCPDRTVAAPASAARAGYETAIATLRGVEQRTGSPAARWAADYLATDPDKLAPSNTAPYVSGGGENRG
jgi:hypothetical protein